MRQMENDEVCAELRQLTSQLRRVSDLNLKRSQVLLDEAVRLPKQLRRWSQQTASPPGLVSPTGVHAHATWRLAHSHRVSRVLSVFRRSKCRRARMTCTRVRTPTR